MQYTSLSHNDQIPLIGLDTWNAESGKLYSALRNAIQIGYRHIDCASSYGNEAEIGTAIRDAIRDKEITRSELSSHQSFGLIAMERIRCNLHSRNHCKILARII